jgi:hypothetical protein
MKQANINGSRFNLYKKSKEGDMLPLLIFGADEGT